jgi:hypothetical protein
MRSLCTLVCVCVCVWFLQCHWSARKKKRARDRIRNDIWRSAAFLQHELLSHTCSHHQNFIDKFDHTLCDYIVCQASRCPF